MTLTTEGLAKVDTALIDHAANELDLLAAVDVDQRHQLVELFVCWSTAWCAVAIPATKAAPHPRSNGS